MNAATMSIETLWGGVFAASLSVRLTAPRRFFVTSFLAGAAGRLACDALITLRLSMAMATAAGAAVVVFIAMLAFQAREAWPVIIISGVLPLAAADAMVKAIWHLMTLPSLEGDAYAQAIKAVGSDTSAVVVTSAAIAAGVSFGIVMMRLFRREELFEEA